MNKKYNTINSNIVICMVLYSYSLMDLINHYNIAVELGEKEAHSVSICLGRYQAEE